MSPHPEPAHRLAGVVNRFPGIHAWVAGDIMLDEYVIGDVRRISPEAPVPVVHVRERLSRLGGATNVARQIAALGSRVSLCGMIGSDAAGDAVLAACKDNGIDARAVDRIEGVHTTHKIRVLAQGQQLVRLDWEETRPCPPEIAERLIDRLSGGEPPDVVVLSDYAKGFLEPGTISLLLETARSYGVPVLVDPKQRDFTVYRGATIVKPNLRELEAATGQRLSSVEDAVIAEAARGLAAAADLGAIVVTLGSRGILTVPRDGEHTAIRSQSRAVYDVTGAGDTTIAVLALSVAAGADLEDAARIANTAAGIAVGEVGAAAVSPADLLAGLAPRLTGKVMTRSGLAAQVEAWRLQGKRVVFTNGCFDLLHIGHLSLLREAAQLGDVLVLAINSDDSVHRLKGDGRPLMPEAERAAILAALDCVDAVTVFEEDTPLETLEQVRPDILVKGQDYRLHEVVGRELVEAAGGRVELVALSPDRSTSELIERIRKSRDDNAE
jgi:D-beta-D-heptose 7-phosphate kinase/D-beta-D-heptose 1-phosphate adenosyltransferase